MSNSYLLVQKSEKLSGEVFVSGSKNAALAIMASLILVKGESTLYNIPHSADVTHMIQLLQDLGAYVDFDPLHHRLVVDTTLLHTFRVREEIMTKMRASMVVTGPLLARFGQAEIAFPGGCTIGSRSIDLHLKGFERMNTVLHADGLFLKAILSSTDETPAHNRRIVLDYPSVGATENIMMLATKILGTTTIVNAAHEPEVFDLIEVLQKMGADINAHPGALIVIKGGIELRPITHTVIADRLEAGALLLAAGMTGGNIFLPNAHARHMDIFLEKLQEMGHQITTTDNGLFLRATLTPRAVSFKTGPYPNFPTDLQAPLMAAQCVANGTSIVEETVFENRLMHVHELQKMGAQINVDGNIAIVRGVDGLYGSEVIATDIRASCALMLAGLVAEGTTKMTGIHHWKRGYDRLEMKIQRLGGNVELKNYDTSETNSLPKVQKSQQ